MIALADPGTTGIYRVEEVEGSGWWIVSPAGPIGDLDHDTAHAVARLLNAGRDAEAIRRLKQL